MKTLWLFILLSFPLYICAQQNSSDALRKKALTLRRFLEQNHYQPLKWDDSASARLYTKWIDELDDEKLFFTRIDIAVLETYKTKLDEEMMGKSWEFFNRSTALYKAALQRADSLIQLILAKPVDLSKPDNIEWPLKDYALNPNELSLRWQKILKWRVLQTIAEKLTEQKQPVTAQLPADFVKLEKDAREKVRRRETNHIRDIVKTPALFSSVMQDEYLNAISWCYDPHTNYMNTAEKNEFDAAVSASEYSAGFDLEENDKGEKTIGYLQPGGSAWRSGQLHNGDVLVAVKSDGVEKKVEDIDDDAELDKIIGSNSQSEMEVTIRTTAGEVKTVKLNREKITDEEGVVKSYVLHGTKNIGYINLPGFYSREDETINDDKDIKYDGCANDVSKEIIKLRKDNISGLILDLRYNGGGSMWEAMQLAGIFIDIGPVASVKDKDGKLHFLKDPNRGTIYDGPLMVLINGASASASEFVSAVLQDYNRALIVGGTTYGKGTAQIVMPMDTLTPSSNKKYDDFVKVTQEKFYRVNGGTTQWKGVIPDISLPDLYSDESFKEKANSSALQPDNVRAGIYQPLPVIPLQSLKVKSEQRVMNDPYFKSIADFSKWMTEYKNGRIIPLQWNTYAVHFSRTADMFKQLDKDKNTTPTGIPVTNNTFDQERIDLSTLRNKEINKTYLDHVQSDMILKEAYNIMLDWINK